MTRNVLLFASKCLLLVLLLTVVQSANAQRGRKSRSGSSDYQSFLDTQWWMGIKFGTNITNPNPQKRFSSIQPIDYEDEVLNKSYESFTEPGVFVGLDLSFYHRGFSVAMTPGFKMVRYGYSSNLEWAGDEQSGLENFETSYQVTQMASFIELPLSFRYEVIQTGNLRPYVMAGVQYSFSLAANKKTMITHTDHISGTAQSYPGAEVSLDTRDEFQNYFGALAGAGVGWDIGNVRTVFELSYSIGLTPITNTDNRFSENELVTLGETNDEVNINGINASLSVVFPLRFLESSFSSK